MNYDSRFKSIETRLEELEKEVNLIKANKEIFLTLDVAAREIGKSELTIRRWVEEGKMDAIKTPKGQLLFSLNEVVLFKESEALGSGYGLKVLYADWVNRTERLAFPKNRKTVAESMTPGTNCLIYLTSPIKRIVGATTITGTVEDGKKNWPDQAEIFARWPYVVPHELITPKLKTGLTLKEAGIDFRPRPGDTFKAIDKDTFDKILAILETQDDYDWEQFLRLH
ncbi:MAG: hypothetical protein KGZ63_11510 [Clostridiales bacterium]|jgi:hypothetical protein|nr:hypothetical protein [Clostridiales bacterium]